MIANLILAVLLTGGPAPLGAGPTQIVYGDVITVNGTGGPASSTIDATATGELVDGAVAMPVRLPAGPHQVSVRTPTGSRTTTITTGPGCTTVLILRPEDQPTATAVVPSCPIPRIPAANASVQIINAAARATSITLDDDATQTAPTPPWSGSAPMTVPTGGANLVIDWPGLGPIREVHAILAPNTAYGLVLIGGGEDPVLTALLVEGVQPPSPVPSGMRINTDRPHWGGKPGIEWPVAVLVVVVGVCVVAQRRRRILALAIAAIVLTACAAGKPVDLARPGSPQPGSPPPTPAATGASASPPPDPATSRFSKSTSTVEPVRLQIAALGINAGIVPYPADQVDELNTRLDGSHVAWLEGTDLPGAPGTAMLAAHVQYGPEPDSAVFHALRDISPGSPVVVTMNDNTSLTFTVETLLTADKGDLDTEIPWIDTPTATPLLELVTCIGPIGSNGLRTENLVVLASLTGT